MNAQTVLLVIQKPGLECWQPVNENILYACSGDEDSDIRYEAKVAGRSIDQVSSVEVQAYRQATENFNLASRPFLGLISAQLEYQGADARRAYDFVNRNLSSNRATSVIGAARWTITTSDKIKELTVTHASEAEASP